MIKKIMKKEKVGVIGVGNMGEAFVTGMLNQKIIPKKNLYFVEIDPKQTRRIKRKYGITKLKNIEELAKKSTIILIAVKPQGMKPTLTELQKHHTNQLILSIAAGIQIKTYQKYLGKDARIIRLMPNTPALIGHGVTVLKANHNCRRIDVKKCHAIFDHVSQVFEVYKESQLDAVTAVSGSGPAFVFEFAKTLIQAGVKEGLPKEFVNELVYGTLLGATRLMQKSKKSPDELTKMVTSKKGTTLAGLEKLEKNGFYTAIEACIKAATKRAKELSCMS